MTLKEQHTALIVYLRAKLEQHDWHGVSDAANDLRVLEAQMQGSCVRPRANRQDLAHG